MEQLLLHLIGDYITQTDWMARNKTKDFTVAFIHAFVYMLPFELLGPSTNALVVILLSHALIDRFSLAKYLIFAKNWITQPSLRYEDCKAKNGYPDDVPAFMSVWLYIIADNTLHLVINYCALRWL